MSQPKRIRLVILTALLLICSITVVIFSILPQIGRVGPFSNFSDNERISATHYSIHIQQLGTHQYTILLKNEVSNATVSLFDNFDDSFHLPFELPSYATFSFQGRQFLITKVKSGGNNNFWQYNVFDISGDAPTWQHNFDNHYYKGGSCADPKLDSNGLEFYGWHGDCPDFDVFQSLSDERPYHLILAQQ